jgi:hypothetical protein
MQWQGDLGADLPIVGLYTPGNTPRLMAQDDPQLRNLNGYGGSLAFANDGTQIAVTSPRGGVIQVMDTADGSLLQEHALADVCGLTNAGQGWIASTGTGHLLSVTKGQTSALHVHDLAWDNHLIRLS